jgi:hypothetical protein
LNYSPVDTPASVVPFAIDLSSLVRRSVATLYSHLVTRPTGQALRLGIESQIVELGSCCLSVLDFTQVVVLDYSCADEAVAKLIQRFQRADRPADVYFLARGLAEQHREPIEAVLMRHRLALVGEIDDGAFVLLGDVEPREHAAWTALQEAGFASAAHLSVTMKKTEREVNELLEVLAARRVVLRCERPCTYHALSRLLPA